MRGKLVQRQGCPPRSGSPEPTASQDEQQQQQQQQQYTMRLPQPYMKQIKLHPSGCQQWSSQIVAGGGVYMAYASTLTTYIYDVNCFSLVTILGGNDCNVHSILWHPSNPHRILVISTNGHGSEWDVRSEERVDDFDVGAPPVCSAWDPADPRNLAIVSKGTNETYLMRHDDSGREKFRKGYARRSSDESLRATCAQWSQHEYGVLATGWTDGRVSFSKASSFAGNHNGKEGRTKLVFPSEDGGSVVDLRHDPNKGPYVLVGYGSGAVVLWDAAGHCAITTFDRSVAGLAGIRWMAWAPGNFLAFSSKTPVSKVFNISQKHPIGTVKLGETGSGVRDMAWLPAQASGTDGKAAGGGPRAICGFRDGSVSVADTAFKGTAGQACGGSGGGVSSSGHVGGGGSGAIPWSSKAGHIETVFTCEHRPGDPDTLATGSYGSSVKVWHVPTMDLKVTLTGQTGAIYCLAWSLDGQRIASTSADGSVWIWDVRAGRALERIRLHSRAVHRVQWDPFNEKRLASVGADRSLVIFSDKGAVHRVYTHPDALFGCNWSPTHKNVIATGCRDGNVRVFDCSWKEGLEPQYVLSGHTQRVFHVCWSPLLEGTLASGSDDASVMVWCLNPKSLPRSEPAGAARKVHPSAVLTGHTSNVRPIHWNSEVPWLLLSGSWDGTVRAWDIRKAGIGRHGGATACSGSAGGASSGRGVRGVYVSAPHSTASSLAEDAAGRGACIASMSDHIADVYGLSASPSRPFCYVSVSRDTTIRVFNLEGIVSSIKTRAIIGSSLHSVLSGTAAAMLPAAPTALCGTASKFVETQLRKLRKSEGTSSINAFQRLFGFFWGSDGIETFWEVVRWVDAAAAAPLASKRKTGGGGAASPELSRGSSVGGQRQSYSSTGGHGAGASRASIAGGGARNSPADLLVRQVPEGLMYVEERVVHRDARKASDEALARLLSESPMFVVQDRRLGKSDRLERAFRLQLAAGDLRGSCETLVALGRWQTALSLAPGVGVEYWRAVADRYVKVLLGGAEARNRPVESEGGSGGQAGTDVTALATALLSATGRPMDAVRDVLKGSEEALSLAVAVAAGAYPPPAQEDPSPREIPLQPAVVAARGVAEEKESSRRRAEEGGAITAARLAAGGRGEEGGGGDAKLLALIDEHLEGANTNAEDGEEEQEEAKASQRHETAMGTGCRRGRAVPPKTVAGQSPTGSSEFKRGAAFSPPPHPRTRRPDSSYQEVLPSTAAAQREHGESMLRSITESKAEAFFQASQPALAAAALLSVCDGSRATAAPALAFLIRGEEPELAYAAAKVLKFPARELIPFVREMARRAEAWGDPNLSVELLLDAGGEDETRDGFEREHHIGGNSDGISGGSSSIMSENGGKGGFWPADVYAACGEESGPRGAALIATRARTGSSGKSGDFAGAPEAAAADPCPSMSLRSRASYLDDAAAATCRGLDCEAVRLLVLAGDLQRACERGVSFLKENVPPLSFPPRPVSKSTSAVVRALGSGGDGGMASSRVSPCLRMEVLAYASYIGAIEAMVRGYNPVVAPLLRTASACVRATEGMALGREWRERSLTHADEKRDDKRPNAAHRSRSASPRRRWGNTRRSGRSSPPSGRSTRSPSPSGGAGRSGRSRSASPRPPISVIFPPCMSTTELALAAVRHLTIWANERRDAAALSSAASRTYGGGGAAAAVAAAHGSPHYTLEVGLGYARRVRDEENSLSAKDAKAADELLSSAERRAAAVGDAAKTLLQQHRKTAATLDHALSPPSGSDDSPDSTAAPTAETKSRDDTADNDGGSTSGGDDGEPRRAREWSSEEKSSAGSRVATGGRNGRRGDRWLGDGQPGDEHATENWLTPSLSRPNVGGEIIVSGSRLPSCRHHERVAWRTPAGDDPGLSIKSPPHSKRMTVPPLATSSLEFGHEVFPRAKGAAFLLEDQETALGLNEAVMWSKVNPFSPLNTGCRILPF